MPSSLNENLRITESQNLEIICLATPLSQRSEMTPKLKDVPNVRELFGTGVQASFFFLFPL